MVGEEQWERLPLSTSSSSPLLYELCEEERQVTTTSTAPKEKNQFTEQLPMRKVPREKAWEKRRKQILKHERRKHSMSEDLTDADLHELKGCIELGFGFNEEDGQRLSSTLPALDLYFAVNRQLSTSRVSTPESTCSFVGRSSSAIGSPGITSDSESWKICSPGDDPEQVKTKLRHWAQAVACSLMQSH